MPDFMVVLRASTAARWRCGPPRWPTRSSRNGSRPTRPRSAYRVQIETKGAPSFSHLGTHVASILEEAGRSSENMLADAAERAQEAIDAAEEEAAEIIKAAEHRAGEIEGEARRTLEDSQAEGRGSRSDAQAAEEMRTQAEQDARTVLEEARDATDMIWQEAERERLVVEAETIRLETLGTGRWSSSAGSTVTSSRCWTRSAPASAGSRRSRRTWTRRPPPPRPGSGSSPGQLPRGEPRFPSPATSSSASATARTGCSRPPGPTRRRRPSEGPVLPPGGPVPPRRRTTPLTDTSDDGTDQPTSSDAETVPDLDAGSGLDAGPGATTEQTPAAAIDATQPVPATGNEPAETPLNGEGGAHDQDATQRLTPVANGGTTSPAPPSRWPRKARAATDALLRARGPRRPTLAAVPAWEE